MVLWLKPCEVQYFQSIVFFVDPERDMLIAPDMRWNGSDDCISMLKYDREYSKLKHLMWLIVIASLC